jgi:hypothetical protein
MQDYAGTKTDINTREKVIYACRAIVGRDIQPS